MRTTIANVFDLDCVQFKKSTPIITLCIYDVANVIIQRRVKCHQDVLDPIPQIITPTVVWQ